MSIGYYYHCKQLFVKKELFGNEETVSRPNGKNLLTYIFKDPREKTI